MSGESEYGFCMVCRKEGNITRTYYHYDLECECHSPKHFEIVWHCPTCEPTEPRETKITLITKNLKKI